MAVDKKISQLDSGAPAQAGDEYVVARSGANYKLTLTNIAASMPPIGATTPNTGSFTSLTNSGNLTFSGTGQRITGDMSNATIANRLAFQTSTTNGATQIVTLPNGTGSTTGLLAYGGSDPANTNVAAFLGIGGVSPEARISSNFNGTGTASPLTFYMSGSERMRLDTSGNLGIGTTPSAVLTPKLQVSSAFSAATASTPYNGVFVESSDAQAADKGGVISLGGLYDASSGPTRFAAIAGLKENGTSGNYAGYLAFYSRANGSPPAERMRIDSSGNVGIGTASPNARLSLGTPFQNNAFYVYDGTAGAKYGFGIASAEFRMYAGSGAVTTFGNYDGTTYTERMRIDSSGNVGIGGTAAAARKVDVLGTLPTAFNFSEAVRMAATIPSGSTSGASCFISFPSTEAASFTCSNLYHFRAVQNTFGAGSTVTNQFGFWAGDNLTGATNNFGFYSNIASGSNRWNFYAAGTAKNYFAGNTGIGVDPTVELDVRNGAGNCTISAQYGTGTKGQLIAAANEMQLKAFNGTNDVMTFYTGASERMRIDSSGNVGIGTTSFGASSQVVLAIANATAVPTGNPTGGGVLYVEAGALKYRGSSGTVTTIANA